MMIDTSCLFPRRRNAAATREAILISARRAFAQKGYDGVGLREIAAGAGVTAMLVNRYFGSKEQLFTEVIAAVAASPIILSHKNLQKANLAEALATALVEITKAGEAPLEGFLIMLHSASSTRAAELGRQQVESGHQKLLTSLLTGELAPQRAALMLSLVAGVQAMRQMMGLSALAQSEPADLIQLLTPLFQQLIDGPAAKEPSDAGL